MSDYEAIHIGPEAFRIGGMRSKRILLVDIKETKRIVSGYEVTGEGDTTGRFHVIDKAVIDRRVPMEINKKYGILEVRKSNGG